ncbi:MAG: hypothetical protein OXG82_18940 [Gammaproteobacteria bacterium]|nr:hypothetical protein [Gammaproteobacteria bacterium]
MGKTRVVLAWLLGASTAFAGAVCACEVSALEGTDAPHAHHAPSSDAGHCIQADDCAECGLTGPAADRQIGLTPASAAAPDDALEIDAPVQVAPRRYDRLTHDPPPRLPLRAADTAVHRFDILLN